MTTLNQEYGLASRPISERRLAGQHRTLDPRQSPDGCFAIAATEIKSSNLIGGLVSPTSIDVERELFHQINRQAKEFGGYLKAIASPGVMALNDTRNSRKICGATIHDTDTYRTLGNSILTASVSVDMGLWRIWTAGGRSRATFRFILGGAHWDFAHARKNGFPFFRKL